MNNPLTAVINKDMDKIVYIPIENRLVSRYLSKHPTLDMMTIGDWDYKKVKCLVSLNVDHDYTNRDFFVSWVKKQTIKDAGKFEEEGLALLHDNLTFDGKCLTDIMINIENTLACWHTATVAALAAKQNLNIDDMDESDLQDAVINHIFDDSEFLFEGVISEGDDYLIVYSDLAGAAVDRAPKKSSERHLPVNS